MEETKDCIYEPLYYRCTECGKMIQLTHVVEFKNTLKLARFPGETHMCSVCQIKRVIKRVASSYGIDMERFSGVKSLTDAALCSELKRRGYSGELKKVDKLKIGS